MSGGAYVLGCENTRLLVKLCDLSHKIRVPGNPRKSGFGNTDLLLRY